MIQALNDLQSSACPWIELAVASYCRQDRQPVHTRVSTYQCKYVLARAHIFPGPHIHVTEDDANRNQNQNQSHTPPASMSRNRVKDKAGRGRVRSEYVRHWSPRL